MVLSSPLQGLLGPPAGQDQTWRVVTEGFLVERTSRPDGRGTADTYARIIRRFLDRVRDPSAVTPLDVHRFAYGLEGGSTSSPAPSTVTVRLAALSGLYDFAVRMGALAENPVAKVRRPRVRPPSPRGLTAAEVERLLAAIPDDAPGLMDRAMILTAVLTGLRRGELANLHVAGITQRHAARYEVRVKGGSIQRRRLPEPARRATVRAAEAACRPLDDGTMRAFPVAETTFYVHLARHARAAGLGPVAPHVLRHTAAKLRRQAGASIEQVSSLLGHRSIATTAQYLARLDDEIDDGWPAVAEAIGVRPGDADPSERAEPRHTAGSLARSRPDDLARRGGRWHDRPVPLGRRASWRTPTRIGS